VKKEKAPIEKKLTVEEKDLENWREIVQGIANTKNITTEDIRKKIRDYTAVYFKSVLTHSKSY